MLQASLEHPILRRKFLKRANELMRQIIGKLKRNIVMILKELRILTMVNNYPGLRKMGRKFGQSSMNYCPKNQHQNQSTR